jgi:hypothetical protein
LLLRLKPVFEFQPAASKSEFRESLFRQAPSNSFEDIGSCGLDYYFQAGMVTRLLLQKADTPLETKRAWLSELAVPGSVIIDNVKRLVGYVIESNQRGVVVWLLSERRISNQRILSFEYKGDKADYDYWFPVKPQDYTAAEVEVLPPGACMDIGEDGRGPGIFLTLKTEKRYRLPVFSAMHGFVGMSVPVLTKFFHEIDCPVDPCPRLEWPLVTALMTFLLPGASEDDMVMYKSRRHNKPPPLYKSALKDADLEVIMSDVMDHNDRHEIATASEDYRKQIEVEASMAAIIKPAAKAKGAAKKKKKHGEKDLLLVASARAYLPDVVGATLTSETEWHTRFKAEYPTALPPHSFSASYDEDKPESIKIAMRSCLRWAWTEHLVATPAGVCPWDLFD